MTASVSRPASTDSMISACPGRRSRILNTSRIFSSARSSAGDGGTAGDCSSGGALAARDPLPLPASRGNRNAPASSSSDRWMTRVGTPSSPTVVSGDCGSEEDGDAALGAAAPVEPAAAHASSSELRLYSCEIAHVAARRLPSTHSTHVHLLQNCDGGRSITTATQPDAGAGPKKPANHERRKQP